MHDVGLTLFASCIAGAVVLAAVAVKLLLARRDSVILAEVVHVGATERWSPIAAVEAVPQRPLGPEEAQRIAEDHEAAIWEDQQRDLDAGFRDAFEVRMPRKIDDTFDGLIRRAERIGHLERDTREISMEQLAEVLGRAGR